MSDTIDLSKFQSNGDKAGTASVAHIIGNWGQSEHYDNSTHVAAAMIRLQLLGDVATHTAGFKAALKTNPSLNASKVAAGQLHKALSTELNSKWESDYNSLYPVTKMSAIEYLRNAPPRWAFAQYSTVASKACDAVQLAKRTLDGLTWNLGAKESIAKVMAECQVDEDVASRWVSSMNKFQDLCTLLESAKDATKRQTASEMLELSTSP